MKDAPLAPAFRSSAHAVAFAAVVLLLLALPPLFARLGLYDRRLAYEEASIGSGGFAYAAHPIFDDDEPLDLLVVGPSTVWIGVDPTVIQEAVSTASGAPARVRLFGHNWVGADIDYAMLHDLLARHRVGTVAIALPRVREEQVEPHPMAHHLLPFLQDESLTAGLPLRERAMLYGEAVLGAPRHLVSLLRRGAPIEHPVAAHLGAKLEPWGHNGAPYLPVDKAPPTIPTEAMIYRPGAPGWRIENVPLSLYQEHFVELIAGLLREHHVRLIAFHVPWLTDRHEPFAAERFDWPTVLGVDGALVGVAPSTLFAGLSEDEILSLYYDDHLNEAGARFFTRAIAPALAEVHLRGR